MTGVKSVAATAAALVCLPLAACSPGDRPAANQPTSLPRAPAPAPDVPVQSMGTDVELGPLSLLDVAVAPPDTDRHRAGENARINLTLVNRGDAEDTLTGVSSPAAAHAAIHFDRACDGTAERVGRLPITASGSVPLPPGAPRHRHGPYYLELVGLTRDLQPTTVPITFTFEHAGTVTVAAIVRPHDPGATAPALFACIGPA